MQPMRTRKGSPPTERSVTFGEVKEEVITSPQSSPKGGEMTQQPPARRGEGSGFGTSPPVFSMDALNDVLGIGQFLDSPSGDGQFSLGLELDQVDKKFSLADIDMSTIEQNADTAAAALFNAKQSGLMGFPSLNTPMNPQQRRHQYPHQHQHQHHNQFHFQPERRFREAAATASMQMPPPPLPSTSSSLPQLEHSLFESFCSPQMSPIYPRVVMPSDKGGPGEDGGDESTDSNVGSDSDFEIDRDSLSSPSSDDSSDSDFNGTDSDSDFGGKKRRVGGRRGRRPGTKVGGGGRKQPYYHQKSSKSKEQAVLLMGNTKPLATRQINAHQLEAIAATMGSSPVTVNWLLQNYETSEGNSLPRALMYGHYLRQCAELRLDPVNAASFGKLIRSVFVGLTTRRLETRGNSKYHYCGIRIKDTSTLLLEDPDLSKKTRSNGKRSKKQQILAMQGVGICGLGGNKGLTLEMDKGGNIEFSSVKKYLGTKAAVYPSIELQGDYTSEGVSGEEMTYFSNVYRTYCWEMMEAMEQFKLENLVLIWNRFWQYGQVDISSDDVAISKETLLTITKLAEVQGAIQHWDGFTYDQFLTILLPNVIGQVPFQLLEEYHKFSLDLRDGLATALSSYDASFAHLKLQLLDAFIDELKSWISLNLSAQAARDSTHSPNSIAQLLSDLNRINFRSVLLDVKEYVTVDKTKMNINVHESLKRILSGPDSIEPWSVWLVGLVEQRLGMSDRVRTAVPDDDGTLNAVVKECQDLSLRWLKYMSQLKLELLLRSSGSLATFLSLELLFSNFLLHLIKVYKSRALQVPLVLYSIVRKCPEQVRLPPPGFILLSENKNGRPEIRAQTGTAEAEAGPAPTPTNDIVMQDALTMSLTTVKSEPDSDDTQLPPGEAELGAEQLPPILGMVQVKQEVF